MSESKSHRFRKIVIRCGSLLAFFLILAGLVVLAWISRPYLVLLFSPSRMKALEEKVKLNEVIGNRIIIPSVLIDAEILEGTSRKNFSKGVVVRRTSASPGQKRPAILEGHNLAEFGLWQPRSFFSLLDVARKDAKIYVYYNGRKYIYKIKEKKQLRIDDPDLYAVYNDSELKLKTCVSTWSLSIYTDWRTLVTAELLSSENYRQRGN